MSPTVFRENGYTGFFSSRVRKSVFMYMWLGQMEKQSFG